jgi:hypothetical protein
VDVDYRVAPPNRHADLRQLCEGELLQNRLRHTGSDAVQRVLGNREWHAEHTLACVVGVVSADLEARVGDTPADAGRGPLKASQCWVGQKNRAAAWALPAFGFPLDDDHVQTVAGEGQCGGQSNRTCADDDTWQRGFSQHE